jgi:arsenate reductase
MTVTEDDQLCDEAAEECSFFPGARRQEHWSIPDPSAASGTNEERLAVLRQVRAAIASRIDTFLTSAAARATI